MDVALRAAMLALGALAAAAARAQHPAPVLVRPLHARLALAEAVAVATVEEVREGRMRVGSARPLSGAPPERFQIKRSPLAPPPLAVGDRALLLLRGARPPYVLVDDPEETIRLADPEAEARWSAAVSAWLSARGRPRDWPALYVAWIRDGPDTLRELAVAGLLDAGAPFHPLAAATYEALGRAAWDEAWSLPARRAAARVALPSRKGSAALAAGFLRSAPRSDSELAQAAVRAASRARDARLEGVLLAALEHSDAEVRRSALRAVDPAAAPPGAPVRARIEALARDEPESWLRAEAQEALARLAAAAPG